MREQTGWMLDLLGDPAVTGAVDRRHARGDAGQRDHRARRSASHAETNVDLAAVVVNRVLPELFGRGEEEVFERLRQPDGVAALARSGRRAGATACSTPPSWPSRCGARGPSTSTRLREGLDGDVELLYVPELFTRHHGVRATRQVAEALGAELGF